jgi:excisionase family DNA binding protein
MSARRLTTGQVAARLGVSRKRVYELIHAGKLRAFNVSIGERQPRWRVEESDLAAFESERSTWKISETNAPNRS